MTDENQGVNLRQQRRRGKEMGVSRLWGLRECCWLPQRILVHFELEKNKSGDDEFDFLLFL